MKWSEVFIVSFLEEYFNFIPLTVVRKGQIECVLSELEKYTWISGFDGAKYYEGEGVKKELGLMYNDLEESYANQGYGEMS